MFYAYLFAGDTQSYGSIDWNALTGTLNSNGEVVTLNQWGDAGDDYFYDSISMGPDHYWIGTKERDGERTGWVLIDRDIHYSTPETPENSEKQSGCTASPLRPFILSMLILPLIRRRSNHHPLFNF